jgi:hypothetical protein
VSTDSEAVKAATANSAAASHLLTYTLTVLMLAACILFAVNAGRSLEHTKVRRNVPGSATSSATGSSANLDAARNSSLRGSNPRPVSSDNPSENLSDAPDNKAQSRRALRLLRRAAAASVQRSNESVKKTIKDSSPNSPIGGVDQSKFELLRRLKSSASQN